MLLLGLGASLFEGARCDDVEEAAAEHLSRAEGAGPGEAGGSATHCCPCIHSFPTALRAVVIPAPRILAESTGYGHAPESSAGRQPQPPIPPPIA
jgi:hypothetical protein